MTKSLASAPRPPRRFRRWATASTLAVGIVAALVSATPAVALARAPDSGRGARPSARLECSENQDGSLQRYNHFRRLKIPHSPNPITPIAATATGYPNSQCSSGMVSKFIP